MHLGICENYKECQCWVCQKRMLKPKKVHNGLVHKLILIPSCEKCYNACEGEPTKNCSKYKNEKEISYEK